MLNYFCPTCHQRIIHDKAAGAVPQQEPQERTPTALDETWRAMGIQTIAQSELNATNSAALETEQAKRRALAVPSLPEPQEQDRITVNDFVCAVGEMTNADALQRVKELVRSSDKRRRA